MNTTKAIKQRSEFELKQHISGKASWHENYKNSAYIFIGSLNYDMNEGDLVTVFSQYGEIVDLNLIRDEKTGKSKGYAFLAYEDQRSTILAVDNFNGINLCDRIIRVDHVENYRPPKLKGSGDLDESALYKPTGPDGRGWGKYREYTEEELAIIHQNEVEEVETENNVETIVNKIKEKAQITIANEDELWEKALMTQVERDKYDDNKEIVELRKKIEEEKLLAKRLKKEQKKSKKKSKKSKKELKETMA